MKESFTPTLKKEQILKTLESLSVRKTSSSKLFNKQCIELLNTFATPALKRNCMGFRLADEDLMETLNLPKWKVKHMKTKLKDAGILKCVKKATHNGDHALWAVNFSFIDARMQGYKVSKNMLPEYSDDEWAALKREYPDLEIPER